MNAVAANISDFINRKIVKRQIRRQLKVGDRQITAIDVSAALFPELVAYVALVMEQSDLRISDDQPDINEAVRYVNT